MAQSTRKVIILGSGPGGMTAAIYAARANLDEGRQDPGGPAVPVSERVYPNKTIVRYPRLDDGIELFSSV